MKILITGSKGFIARNLIYRLQEAGFKDLITIDRESPLQELEQGLKIADFIYHLAGVNRPKEEHEFQEGNTDLTKLIVDFLLCNAKKTPIMLSSSIQVECDNAYGKSKASAEKIIQYYGHVSGAEYYIYRLPNVFGKWCRPNYNSFVATFCHRIANDQDIIIHDPTAEVELVYIDDFCTDAINLLNNKYASGFKNIKPTYSITVGEVANLIYKFKESRHTLITENVGQGFSRALYSTWLSYLQPEQFVYAVPSYSDERGVFCEVLKTHSSGQFSFFTALPGVTRGGHYHHTKNEKFVVIRGTACFRFKNVLTGERYEINVASDEYKIVETVPGWSHDITNTGHDELIVMLWANEIFNRDQPDTIASVLS
ncbi:UDP-2-acetamido-2,6-beta-L-arabino-hexul-4-ose reductase [Escherichia coli]|uniref:UDP-2-acetamido-2,6-beta-L-arabino-hexul-4-ose reductase n=1 Tax=Escherichia coli TaxID=562 RepID=UPI0013249396|nr:capsular polysaccharide biosynthesis protein CapF [Escherichia coli]MXE61505.1 capsular polysaccharide biosynthesis protein CapF [Escherichia coli]